MTRASQGSDLFCQDVVKSVALSCLLSMDFVPKSKPPPIAEMVKHELPRVLSTITKTQSLGAVEVELRHPVCADPVLLLKQTTKAITNFDLAREAVTDHGHEDTVLSALRYSGKPPTATCDRIADITRKVALVLEVDVPNDFDERIGEAYDSTHTGMITRSTNRDPLRNFLA